jgi:hypothetical protein
MNVDGHPDVVVAQGAPGSGKVQLYLGNGAGGLAPGSRSPRATTRRPWSSGT